MTAPFNPHNVDQTVRLGGNPGVRVRMESIGTVTNRVRVGATPPAVEGVVAVTPELASEARALIDAGQFDQAARMLLAGRRTARDLINPADERDNWNDIGGTSVPRPRRVPAPERDELDQGEPEQPRDRAADAPELDQGDEPELDQVDEPEIDIDQPSDAFRELPEPAQ